ncbi:MAG: hypothetical protein QNJ92_06040, partial [Alphaproteobacteria bacterium]|nr:hypothetical protein [Alphaproteobacteria bacterium]
MRGHPLVGLLAVLIVAGIPVLAGAQNASEPSAQDTAEPSAIVIELLVEAGDTVSVRGSRFEQDQARPLATVSDDALVLDPSVITWLRRRDANVLLRADEDVRGLTDVAVAVLERRRFAGELRNGEAVVLWLQRDLPAFPEARRPESVLITPVGAQPPLFDLINWPVAEWKIDETERDAPVLEVDA